MDKIQASTEKFAKLIEQQLKRVEALKQETEFIDYQKLPTIVIGICGGDGIGPVITHCAENVLRFLLKEEVASGKIQFKEIAGLTIENRIKAVKAIPDDVLEELKSCHIILKGPTTTPDANYQGPNIESANVAMRRELRLFANVRPVRVPEQGIDWTFFRENTEGAYTLGSCGFDVDEDLAFDFTVTTTQGTNNIARLAFEYAKNNGKNRVSIVTKANIIKATDGKFLRLCKEMAKEYPGITVDDWYIDIMTAKLIDEKRRRDFQVFILPNLYGDIITDEAAEFQGGVGTAGSSNIGMRYAMFEAIHGSAPRMVQEGRAQYADPCSMLRAAALLLKHIGYVDRAEKLERALDFCTKEERAVVITGREGGATSEQFGEYVMRVIEKMA